MIDHQVPLSGVSTGFYAVPYFGARGGCFSTKNLLFSSIFVRP